MAGRRPKGPLKALRDNLRAGLGQLLTGGDPALDERCVQRVSELARVARYAIDRYSAARDELNALDFDDLEARALVLLSDARHPHVLGYWREQVGAVLVDEFQDTNGRQRDLIRGLAGESAAGRLFVVGDGERSPSIAFAGPMWPSLPTSVAPSPRPANAST